MLSIYGMQQNKSFGSHLDGTPFTLRTRRERTLKSYFRIFNEKNCLQRHGHMFHFSYVPRCLAAYDVREAMLSPSPLSNLLLISSYITRMKSLRRLHCYECITP